MTTNIGLEAFIVLAVVRGRSFIAMSPEIQEVDTRIAFTTSLRWSWSEPALRKGQRKRAVSAVEHRSIQ